MSNEWIVGAIIFLAFKAEILHIFHARKKAVLKMIRSKRKR